MGRNSGGSVVDSGFGVSNSGFGLIIRDLAWEFGIQQKFKVRHKTGATKGEKGEQLKSPPKSSQYVNGL